MNKVISVIGVIFTLFYLKLSLDFFSFSEKKAHYLDLDFSISDYLVDTWSLIVIILVSLIGSIFSFLYKKIGVYLINIVVCTDILLRIFRPTYWYIILIALLLSVLYFFIFFKYKGLEKYGVKKGEMFASILLGFIAGGVLIFT